MNKLQQTSTKCLLAQSLGPAASLASAFVTSPLSLQAFTKPACSTRTCRVQPARMTADKDADEEIKVSVSFRHTCKACDI